MDTQPRVLRSNRRPRQSCRQQSAAPLLPAATLRKLERRPRPSRRLQILPPDDPTTGRGAFHRTGTVANGRCGKVSGSTSSASPPPPRLRINWSKGGRSMTRTAAAGGAFSAVWAAIGESQINAIKMAQQPARTIRECKMQNVKCKMQNSERCATLSDLQFMIVRLRGTTRQGLSTTSSVPSVAVTTIRCRNATGPAASECSTFTDAIGLPSLLERRSMNPLRKAIRTLSLSTIGSPVRSPCSSGARQISSPDGEMSASCPSAVANRIASPAAKGPHTTGRKDSTRPPVPTKAGGTEQRASHRRPRSPLRPGRSCATELDTAPHLLRPRLLNEGWADRPRPRDKSSRVPSEMTKRRSAALTTPAGA